MDWQSYIAAGIVIVTVVVFVVRLAWPRQKAGCGHHCGCGGK
jgi:hypothetical protein